MESARAKYEAERGTDLEEDVLLAKRSSAKQELADQEKRLLELLKKYPNNPEQEDIVDVSGRLERAWRDFNQIESQIAASEKQSSTAKKSAETPLLSERAPKSGKKDDSSADFESPEERPFDHWRERLQEAESQLSAAEEAFERMRASHAPNSREVQHAAGEVEIAEQRVNAARNKLETVSEETSTQAPELSVAEMNRRYESAKSLVASAQASYRDSEAEFSEDPDNSALIAARGRVRTAWRYLNHILLQMEAAGQSTTAATEGTRRQRSIGRSLIQSGQILRAMHRAQDEVNEAQQSLIFARKHRIRNARPRESLLTRMDASLQAEALRLRLARAVGPGTRSQTKSQPRADSPTSTS